MQRRIRNNTKGITIENEEYIMSDTEVEEVIEPKNHSYKNKIGEKLSSIKNYTINFTSFILNACSIYFMWIVLHYFASHCYIYFCTPNTFIGFIYSPFIVASPHCRAMRWVIFNGSVAIDNMWIVLGTWLCTKIIAPRLTS
jgi:hypothetical protein